MILAIAKFSKFGADNSRAAYSPGWNPVNSGKSGKSSFTQRLLVSRYESGFADVP